MTELFRYCFTPYKNMFKVGQMYMHVRSGSNLVSMLPNQLTGLLCIVPFESTHLPSGDICMERKSTQNICACIALDLCVRTI